MHQVHNKHVTIECVNMNGVVFYLSPASCGDLFLQLQVHYYLTQHMTLRTSA